MPRTYLFVCTSGVIRNVAAASHFSRLLSNRGITANIERASLTGSYCPAVTREQCALADRIFVMGQEEQEQLFRTHHADPTKIVNLDILRIYHPGDLSIHPEWVLDGLKSAEYNAIANRPEMRGRWSLGEVLRSRRLEQYILED